MVITSYSPDTLGCTPLPCHCDPTRLIGYRHTDQTPDVTDTSPSFHFLGADGSRVGDRSSRFHMLGWFTRVVSRFVVRESSFFPYLYRPVSTFIKCKQHWLNLRRPIRSPVVLLSTSAYTPTVAR